MGKIQFVEQLKACGYQIREPFTGFIVIDYKIDVGKLFGTDVDLGFYKIDSFPDIPPGGPIFGKPLIPFNNTINTHPTGGIHHVPAAFPELPLGAEWQYWSRPCNGWAKTDKTVETYLSHIRHLLDTL